MLSMTVGPFQAISELIVASTIPQDRSLGREADEDLNLASFGQQLMSKAQSHNGTKSTTISTAPTELEPPQTHGNYVFLDYQMRLMALEQQNKKRLMLAQQQAMTADE